MEITLIRHGKSLHKEGNWINSKQFQQWVMEYDKKGIESVHSFPDQTVKAVTQAEAVAASDLKRSMDSASLLCHHGMIVTDPLYREAELPILSLPNFLRLKPSAWLILSRVIWLTGVSRQAESYKKAKVRARLAAEQLTVLSQTHRQVVLFGHGLFNRMIANELQSMGWSGQRKPQAKHWHAATYKRIDS